MHRVLSPRVRPRAAGGWCGGGAVVVQWWCGGACAGQTTLGRSRITTSVVDQARATATGAARIQTKRGGPALTGDDDPEGRRQEQRQVQRQEREGPVVAVHDLLRIRDRRGQAGRRDEPLRGVGVDVEHRAGGEGGERAGALRGAEDQPGPAGGQGLRVRVAGAADVDDREVRPRPAPSRRRCRRRAAACRGRGTARRTSRPGRRRPRCRPGRAAPSCAGGPARRACHRTRCPRPRPGRRRSAGSRSVATGSPTGVVGPIGAVALATETRNSR